MNKTISIKFLSFLVNILTCLAGAIIILYLRDWFGAGDISAFVFWTVPFAAGLGVAGKTVVNLFKTRTLLARKLLIVLSAILLSFGWACCVVLVLGPWAGAFSIPILYLWICGSILQLLFLEWRLPKPAEKQKFIKVFLSLLLFPLTIIVMVICLFGISMAGSYFTRPEKETYLIPENFEGQFRVIYGEKCGINPSYENGRRVLAIPENGILIIQPAFKAGIIDHEYYLVDKNGKRRAIKKLLDYQQGKKEAGVQLGGSGSMGGAMPDGSYSTESPLAIHFTDFTVFNKNSIEPDEKTAFKFEQRFDSLSEAIVNACREGKPIRKSIYHLDDKTRKAMIDSLVNIYKQYGIKDAEKEALGFVNKYEALQIEQQDSITYMSDIYVGFKHSKTNLGKQKNATKSP